MPIWALILMILILVVGYPMLMREMLNYLAPERKVHKKDRDLRKLNEMELYKKEEDDDNERN